MGVASGCGEQGVGVVSGNGWNRFPHTTYLYSSCICSFLQQHPYFLFIFFSFFVLCYVYLVRETQLQYFLPLLFLHKGQ